MMIVVVPDICHPTSPHRYCFKVISCGFSCLSTKYYGEHNKKVIVRHYDVILWGYIMSAGDNSKRKGNWIIDNLGGESC